MRLVLTLNMIGICSVKSHSKNADDRFTIAKDMQLQEEVTWNIPQDMEYISLHF